ncbi:hypothetical protein AURDEDRAFT_62110 [Auricularia subglabra TFB-10046 SS5]|nr:hypothetical protein AURDEDRAFT_62110 [Auricularia subglabra TFB-10046 SS5]
MATGVEGRQIRLTVQYHIALLRQLCPSRLLRARGFCQVQIQRRQTGVNNQQDPVGIIPGRFVGYRHPSGEVLLSEQEQRPVCPGEHGIIHTKISYPDRYTVQDSTAID